MKKRVLIIGICLILFVPAWLTAKDIYVKAGASGRGAKNNPYGYLWKAISKAERGDVIHVAKGTYNGKGGSGNFTIKIPNLSLVGGYNADFSKRHPFKNLTILERAKDYKGDWTGLKGGIIEGMEGKDHSGLTVDGFVLNSKTRNSYRAGFSKINPKKSWKDPLFKAYSPNVKLRNCMLLNPYGNGIYVAWRGKENEVVNNFILNTFYASVSTRSAQPDSVIKIKNNTILFSWFQPGKGGAWGVYVGRQGKTIIDSNIIGFLQTEGGEAGIAVINGFGNEDTEVKNNIFTQCQGGYYKYMDEDGKNLIIWKKSELNSMEDDAEDLVLAEGSGNTDKDPALKPDKWYFGKFANFIASSPGKLKMDALNKWRRAVGLSLQAGKGSPRSNWGMPYPVEKVYPNLISKTKKGVIAKETFETYSSKAASADKDYKEVAFNTFSKGGPAKAYTGGKDVTFKAGIGPKKYNYALKKLAPRKDYTCVMLLLPGEKKYTRKYVYGYLLKGSKPFKRWKKYMKKSKKYNKRGGIKIKGTAWYLGKDNSTYPVGVIIDEIRKK